MGHMYSLIFCIVADGFPEHHPPLKYVSSYLEGDPKAHSFNWKLLQVRKPHTESSRECIPRRKRVRKPTYGEILVWKNQTLIGETLFPHKQRMYHGGDSAKGGMMASALAHRHRFTLRSFFSSTCLKCSVCASAKCTSLKLAI